MITTNNSFSLKLKALRQKNNLTQEQLEHTLLPIGDYEKERVRDRRSSRSQQKLISTKA